MPGLSRRKFIGGSIAATALAMDATLRALPTVSGVTGHALDIDPGGLGNVTGCRIDGNMLLLSIGKSQLTYRILSPHLIRGDYNHDGKVDPPTPVLDPAAEWPSMIGNFVRNDGKAITIETSGFRIKISQTPCRMTVYDAKGKSLLEEGVGGGIYIDPANPRLGGLRFSHASGQPFYGIKAYPSVGPQSHDTSLLRGGAGNHSEVYQCDASWGGGGGAPFVWTTDGYGILIDSDGGFFAMSETDLNFSYGHPGIPMHAGMNTTSATTPTAGYAWRSKTITPCIYPRPNSVTCFLMIGTPDDIFNSLAEVTGRAKMFPRWATGFTNSQWGINQDELIDIVDGYRARNIPIDNFAIDFDWKAWGENNFGEFRWNEKKFPAALLPPTHFDNLKNIMDRRQIGLTGIMKPRIIRCTTPGKLKPMTSQALSALKAGVWYPGQTRMVDYVHQQYAVLINFNLPDGRRWYWQQTRRHGAMNGGLSGFWNDEADGFNNFFFMHMQQSLYEGERSRSDLRVWSINRNFYLGSQRYAYGTWSGDIAPGFKSMAHQALRMLSMISLGQARWSMDAGNWGPPTPEAYTRWLQFAAFIPIFRVHAPHENSRLQPWLYGFRAQEIAVHAIRLRYTLSPYIYALDRGLHDSGIGMVRPMMMAFPDDPQCADIVDQWMFGPSLLAAPVLAPTGVGKEKSSTRSVYLPKGRWIDFFRGHQYSGNQSIRYRLNTDAWTDVPLFVREGAIIPTMAPVASLDNNPPELVYLDVFPAIEQATATVYDDDGRTYAYERGVFCRQEITVREGTGRCDVHIGGTTGSYDSTIQHFIIRLHGRAGTSTTLNGETLRFEKNPNDIPRLQRDIGWSLSRDVFGTTTLVRVPARLKTTQHLVINLLGQSAAPPEEEVFCAQNLILWGTSLAERPRFSTSYPGYRGQGFIAGLDKLGAAVTCYVRRPKSGTYRMRVLAVSGARTASSAGVYVNGRHQGQLSVPAQNEDGQWVNVSKTIPLLAGNNILSILRDKDNSGSMYVDRVAVAYTP